MSEEVTKEKRRVPLTIITNSEGQSFRDCRKKHDFAYVRGLRPIVAARPLAFGVAFHAGTEAMRRSYGLVPLDELPDFATERGIKAIDASFDEWLEKAEEERSDIQALYEEAMDARETARWMLTHYVKTFRRDFEAIVPLGIELPFHVQLRNVAGALVPHLRYEGVIDFLGWDAEFEDIVIMDDKTTSGPVDTAIDRRVEMDPQMAGYLNALREMLRTNPELLVAGIPPMHPFAAKARASVLSRSVSSIGRVAYNVARKKRPREPSINKDGSLSAAACDTLPEVYRAAMDQAALRGKPPIEKHYELLRVLEAKGDTYLSRREFYRNAREVEEWRVATFAIASDIRACASDPRLVYRNPGHCSNAWSLPCTYRGPCLDESPEMLRGFEVQARHAEVENAKAKEEQVETTWEGF